MERSVSSREFASPRLGLALFLMPLLVGCDLGTPSHPPYGRPPFGGHQTRRDIENRDRELTLAHEVEVLRCLNRCLGDDEREKQEYPASLDTLGGKGTSCVATELATPYLDPSFSYHPTHSAGAGAPDGYSLEVHAKSRPNVRMRTEETGTLFLWFHDRFVPVLGAWQERYEPAYGIGWLGWPGQDQPAPRISRAADDYRRLHPDRGYPEAIAEMTMFGDGDEVTAGLRRGRLDGFLYQYKPEPRGPDGAVHHYRLDVRPLRYGQPWKTSLHVEDSNNSGWYTKEDRAALPTDPAGGGGVVETLVATTLGQEAEVLRLFNRCLADYEHERLEYPASLDALGANGTHCAVAELAAPHPDPSFSYRPMRSAGSGATDGYLLGVEAKVLPDVRMSTDETGTLYLWSRWSPRIVPVQGPREEHEVPQFNENWSNRNVIDVVAWDVVDLAETYRRLHPDRGYPETIAEMGDVGGELAIGLRRGLLDGYLYKYKPGPCEPDGAVHHFRLDVRPIRYGRPWKTSLHVVDGGGWWSTKEDRAAVPTDRAVSPPWLLPPS